MSISGSKLLWAALALAISVSLVGYSRNDASPDKSFHEAESAYQRGDLPRAEREAGAGYQRSLASPGMWAGRFRILQVQAMLGHGDYEQALVQFAHTPPAVFAACELLARRDLLEAFAHNQLGQDAEVHRSMRQAAQRCRSPDPILAADLLKARGQLEDAPNAAEQDYLAALAMVRQQHDSYREAAALVNLGQSAIYQEHYDESIGWNQSAMEVAKKLGYRAYEEKAEGNLAWDYYKLGDFKQATALAVAAEEQARILEANYEQIRWRNNLGILHEQTGDFRSAESDYRQALALSLKHKDSEQATIAVAELAYVSIRASEWQQAAEFSQQALESARKDENHPVELQALLAQGLIAAHRGDQQTAEKLLSQVAHDRDHEFLSSRWEAQGALADFYVTVRRTQAAEEEYRAALGTARQARCSIQHEDLRMPFFANTTRVFDSYIDFLVGQGKIAEALRTADESRALTLAEGLGIEGKRCLASEAVFDPQRLARQARATILFYWLGSEHSYLWAVGPQRTKIYPVPPRGELEPALQAYRKALTGSRDLLESGDASGEQLYRTLVAPAAEFFHPDGRVIVITDGSMSRLSFESLIAPQPQRHYWIEDVTIENASSLRLMAAGREKRGAGNGKLLLMGDPLPPGEAGFEALPHAGEEMGDVRKYFAATDEEVFDRNGSTASAYMASHPERFSYIHFVAHGTASESSPLDSAVVLSPSPNGDYKLYARDVIARPLHAELVTVSACHSAGAVSYAGEGLVGLSWAFLHAGAHRVIGALWDVSDDATPQLMDRMYAGLVKGKSPEAALRTAKLSLLHSGQVFRKPYYWAAFQLYTGS